MKKDINSSKLFSAWKSDSNSEPIEGTDRLLKGRSKRWILQHLAAEEKVNYNPWELSVKLEDGTSWNVTEL